MDYIRQLNAFYDLDMPNQLTPNATSLYFALLNIGNKLYWRADFGVSNLRLQSVSGLANRRSFERARNMLVQRGLVKYVPSGQVNRAGTYTIIPLEVREGQKGVQIDAQESAVRQIPVQNDARSDAQNVAQSVAQDGHISTPNKTYINGTSTPQPPTGARRTRRKRSTAPDPEATAYAEFVYLTNAEYTALVARLGSDQRARRCIEILDNYKGSTGKTYASDYRAILNWVITRLEDEESRAPKPGRPQEETRPDNVVPLRPEADLEELRKADEAMEAAIREREERERKRWAQQ